MNNLFVFFKLKYIKYYLVLIINLVYLNVFGFASNALTMHGFQITNESIWDVFLYSSAQTPFYILFFNLQFILDGLIWNLIVLFFGFLIFYGFETLFNQHNSVRTNKNTILALVITLNPLTYHYMSQLTYDNLGFLFIIYYLICLQKFYKDLNLKWFYYAMILIFVYGLFNIKINIISVIFYLIPFAGIIYKNNNFVFKKHIFIFIVFIFVGSLPTNIQTLKNQFVYGYLKPSSYFGINMTLGFGNVNLDGNPGLGLKNIDTTNCEDKNCKFKQVNFCHYKPHHHNLFRTSERVLMSFEEKFAREPEVRAVAKLKNVLYSILTWFLRDPIDIAFTSESFHNEYCTYNSFNFLPIDLKLKENSLNGEKEWVINYGYNTNPDNRMTRKYTLIRLNPLFLIIVIIAIILMFKREGIWGLNLILLVLIFNMFVIILIDGVESHRMQYMYYPILYLFIYRAFVKMEKHKLPLINC